MRTAIITFAGGTATATLTVRATDADAAAGAPWRVKWRLVGVPHPYDDRLARWLAGHATPDTLRPQGYVVDTLAACVEEALRWIGADARVTRLDPPPPSDAPADAVF